MVNALYPGTFDPITYGHIRIIERATPLFDRITVAVSSNKFKNPLFTPGERLEMLREAMKEAKNLEITSYDELTVDYARRIGAKVIIRGLRAVTDYHGEVQMAIMNRTVAPDIETLLMVAEENYSFLSSSLIKEMAWHDGSIGHLVPDFVVERLRQRMREIKDGKIPGLFIDR